MARMRPLRAGQIETRQNRKLEPIAPNLAALNQQLPDCPVEFAPLLVGGTYYQCPLASLVRAQILFGDRPVAIGGGRNLGDPILLFERLDHLRGLACRREFDRPAQFRIALAADDIQRRDGHPGLLHLVDRPSGFDRMMLALVADEDDPLDTRILRQMEQPVHLPGGEQTRFIDDPKFPAVLFGRRILEQARYRARQHSGFSQRLDAAAGGSEASNEVALAPARVREWPRRWWSWRRRLDRRLRLASRESIA